MEKNWEGYDPCSVFSYPMGAWGDMDKVLKKYIFVKYDTDRENDIHFCFFYETGRLQVYEKSTDKTSG